MNYFNHFTIIGSVGFENTEAKTRKIILAGADAIRINLSRHSIEENLEIVRSVNHTIEDVHANTRVILDMPISKTRLGDFDMKIFTIREQEEIIFKSASYSPDCNQFIPVQIPKLGERVHINQTITVGDGEVALQVVDIIDSTTILMKALNNGSLQYMRTFNLEKERDFINIPGEYQKIISHLNTNQFQYLTIGYFDAETNAKINELVESLNIEILLRIEDQAGLDDIEKIMANPKYEAIVFDRGELGVNIPYEQVGIYQKNICYLAKQHKKPLIISTQILESTINNYTPARSDILDLTNLVLDGARGIILSRETGYKTRPAYTISVAKKIVAEAEKYKTEQANKNSIYYDFDIYSGA